MHKSACSIINENEQSAARGAALEPVVRRAVYLAKLSKAGAAFAALMNAGQFGSACLPNASSDHQLSDSFNRQSKLMRLGEFLTGKRRPEVLILGADERKSLINDLLGQTVIAWFAASL
jgi:hypothetical protein